MSEARMPLTAHLEELRRRIIYCAYAVGAGFIVCYFFKEKLFEILMLPLLQVLPKDHPSGLIYTAPHEAFMTYLKVSFLAGTGLAVPVILFQVWRFIAPGLYDEEKRYFIPVVLLSSFFFLGGALFGYFVVFPFGFQFFVSFATDFISPMISTKEYLSFASRLLFAFGFIFELPIFAFFLARLGILHSSFLRRQRKYAILVIFIVAAFLTPPDVFTQMLMAGPLLILYELSVIVVRVFERKPKTFEDVEEEEPGAAS